MASRAIVWLRNDLRLADNPALVAACASAERVLPVFIWHPAEHGAWAPGAASRAWLMQSLALLRASLAERGAGLVIRSGMPAEVLVALATEVGASAVCWNRRYEPALAEADAATARALDRAGLLVRDFPGTLLHEPGAIVTARTSTGDDTLRVMRRPIPLKTVVAALAVLLVAGAGLWATVLWSAGTKGKAEAEAGATSLASLDATGAAAQFGAAKRDFSLAKRMLGPDWLGAALSAVPLVGRQYSTTRELVAIGLDSSTGWAELAVTLNAPPADSGEFGPTDGLNSLFKNGGRGIDAALTTLVDVADRAASLDERGLMPPLAGQVRSVKAALEHAAPLLDRSRGLLPLEKYLLSSTRRILVVSQNGAELRPTGGFTGSYGVIEVGPTGVRLDQWRDIYVLPDPPYEDAYLVPSAPDGFAVPPGARMTSDFGFREANWWIDYPASARAMLGYWTKYGQPSVDGVVVVDTIAIEYLLEALGPVEVPSFSETFTPENLLTRLLYYTAVKGGEGRKDVLVALATELERRMLGAGPEELVKTAQALAKAADAKHVQMYFTDPGAEAAVIALGWSGRTAPPAGTTDLLVISNAMNLGSKINMAMEKTIDYEVALMPDRSARSTLVLGYANMGPYTLDGRDSFDNWLRVSRAPGAVFAPSGGGYRIVESALPTEVRTFSVLRGQTHREILIGHVPAAWRVGGTLVDSERPFPTPGDLLWVPEGASRYRLFIVRQADLEDIPTTVSVTPPPGWRVSGVSSRLIASGTPLPASSEAGRARLAVPLSGDLILDVWLVPNQ